MNQVASVSNSFFSRRRLARYIVPFLFIAFTFFIAFTARKSLAQSDPGIDWVEGPATVEMGDSLAELSFDENFLFAYGADTKKLMESMGNPVSGREIGLVYPKGEAQWFVVFEYDDVGYVKDDDKYFIDAEKILKSIKEGTEFANKERRKRGFGALNVIGWRQEPFYDDETHNLVWSILAEDEGSGEEVVNYNTRLLGRSGYVAVTLVAPPEVLDFAIDEIEYLISNFSYLDGKGYFDFVSGDKIAQYGLTALIAGGAGAAAAKFGLFAFFAKFFAKLGKAAIVVVAVIAAFIGGIIKSIFGKKD